MEPPEDGMKGFTDWIPASTSTPGIWTRCPAPTPTAWKWVLISGNTMSTYSPGNFVVKAGSQQIAWGEADALRLADVINPLDLSWYWSFPAWEEIRIPLTMLDVVVQRYIIKNQQVTLPITA